MPRSAPPALERLRFWQGQKLRAVDWRAWQRGESRRARLHVQALHRVPGISLGLEVTPQDAHVQVACGLAYDRCGRELLLQQTHVLSWPVGLPEGTARLLVLRPRSGGRAEACCEAAPQERALRAALEDAAELAWREPQRLGVDDGVALARFVWKGGAPQADAAFRARRARAEAGPRLAQGESVRGHTRWEPWQIEERVAQGVRRRVVGVQVRIDTSAAGFTRTPAYFVTLQSPAWDLDQARLAPAFLGHVAEPSAEGFTFRLLMQGLARRRYTLPFTSARLRQVSRDPQAGVQATLDNATGFKPGDAVALLRPHGAERAVSLAATAAPTDELTLQAVLPGVAEQTWLALGQLPRSAEALAVDELDEAVVRLDVALSISAGDVLVRLAEAARPAAAFAVGRVDADSGALHLSGAAGLRLGDRLHVARAGGALRLKSVEQGGASGVFTVRTRARHRLRPGAWVVRLPGERAARAAAAPVELRGDALELPASFAGGLQLQDRLAVVGAEELGLSALEPSARRLRVKLTPEELARFEPGDWVARTPALQTPGVVVAKEGAWLVVEGALTLAVGQVLLAAERVRATQVTAIAAGPPPPGPLPPTVLEVGRRQALEVGQLAARLAPDGTLGVPRVVTAVTPPFGAVLAGRLPDLATNDTLVVAEFPGLAKLTQVLADGRLRVATPVSVRVGQQLTELAANTTRETAAVVAVQGDLVTLSRPLEGLAPGALLGSVHYSGAGVVTGVEDGGLRLELDRVLPVRPGAVVALLAGWRDNSAPARVRELDGTTLALDPGLASFVTGDGLVAESVLGSAIVGFASLAFDNGDGSWPWPQFQPVLRLDTVDGIASGSRITVGGDDLLSGKGRSLTLYVWGVDAAGRHVFLWPAENTTLQVRPETAFVVVALNADFPGAFTAFAQQQGLYVSWTGCLEETLAPESCPATQAGAGDACGGREGGRA